MKWIGRWWDCGKEGTAEAGRKYRKLLALWSIDPTAVPEDDEAYSVAELCRDYRAAAPFSPGETVQVRRAIALLLDLHLDTVAAEFGPAAFSAWLKWLSDKKRADGQPLYTRTYLGKLRGVVLRIWRWGAAHERVTAEAWRGLEAAQTPRGGRRSSKPKGVTAEDVGRTLPHLSPGVRALVTVQRWTGARPSELFGLRPCDLDRSGPVWVARLEDHKTVGSGQDRTLRFGPKAQAALREVWPVADDGEFFSPKRSWELVRTRIRKTPGPKLRKPRRKDGDQYDRYTYARAVKRACDKVGIVPHWTPYDLRRLYLTEVRENYSLDHAQAVAGHASLTTTQVYAGRRDSLADKVAAEMG